MSPPDDDDLASTALLELRPHAIGDVGWVIQRQALLYAREYGWDGSFEALLAEIGAHFLRHFDARREHCWIAHWQGQPVGAVFCVDAGDGVAKLRMLHVEPQARGMGIGGALVDACIGFARARGYHTLTLWTHDVLASARRLYEQRGFRRVAREPHRSFGKDLVGEHWNLTLQEALPGR